MGVVGAAGCNEETLWSVGALVGFVSSLVFLVFLVGWVGRREVCLLLPVVGWWMRWLASLAPLVFLVLLVGW